MLDNNMDRQGHPWRVITFVVLGAALLMFLAILFPRESRYSGRPPQKLISEKEAIEVATKALKENHPRFRVDNVRAHKEDAEKRWLVFFEGDRQFPGNHMLVELSLNGDVLNIHRGR